MLRFFLCFVVSISIISCETRNGFSSHSPNSKAKLKQWNMLIKAMNEYEIYVPDGFELRPGQGMDSYVAKISNDTLEFSYGHDSFNYRTSKNFNGSFLSDEKLYTIEKRDNEHYEIIFCYPDSIHQGAAGVTFMSKDFSFTAHYYIHPSNYNEENYDKVMSLFEDIIINVPPLETN